MSDDNGKEALAAVLLGQGALHELRALGLRPVLSLVSADGAPAEHTPEQLDELIAALEARRAHYDRLASAGELGAGVVHEVRNWVGSIRGFADLARNQEVSARVLELLDRIHGLTGQCAESLAWMLGYVQRVQEASGPFAVSDAIDRAHALVRHQLEVNGVRVSIHHGEAVGSALGRSHELVQVLVNLGLNAQQAMGDGGHLEITSRVEDGWVVIAVADDGPGIPAANRARVLEPFFTTKPQGAGTGLGLAISARLVAGWGGSLEVGESDSGGALFTIRVAAAGTD